MDVNYNILETVQKRLERNQNWLCVVTGDTGTGKSWLSILMADKLSKMLGTKFSIDSVAFTPKELVNTIKTIPPKSTIIMDEAGVNYGARDFMRKENKALGSIFQMFRFKQLALIYTLPDSSMLDINARRLMHVYIETLPIDYRRNLSQVKWFNVHINRWSGEIIHKYPRVVTKNGYSVVKVVKFPKPSEALINAYEKKKSDAFDDLMDRCERILTEEESPRKVTKEVRPKKEKVNENLCEIPDYMWGEFH